LANKASVSLSRSLLNSCILLDYLISSLPSSLKLFKNPSALISSGVIFISILDSSNVFYLKPLHFFVVSGILANFLARGSILLDLFWVDLAPMAFLLEEFPLRRECT